MHEQVFGKNSADRASGAAASPEFAIKRGRKTMLFGKHLNKYYLKYLPAFLLGIIALLVVDYMQLLRPEIYRMVINGLIDGSVEIDGVVHDFDMAFLLNSTAVFCIDRNKYFDMLQIADDNTAESQLKWCEYVLTGLNNEMSKVSKLMDKKFFNEKIVQPAINKAFDLHFISNEYKLVLELVLNAPSGFVKSKDIQMLLKDKTKRQITTLISKMLEADLLQKLEPNSRLYMLNLFSKDLARGVIESLYNEQFISVQE